LYEQQDEERWNQNLYIKGFIFSRTLHRAMNSHPTIWRLRLSMPLYKGEDSPEKWAKILQWYDRLLVVNYSPAAALNRIFALYKVKVLKLH
jgi:RNA polymerase sigma-70 factor (ECF subfamily)